MTYRIIYKRIYDTEKEAVKELKNLTGKASNPKIAKGQKAGWVIVLYESNKRSRIDEGIDFYKSSGLPVFVQELV